MSITKIPYKIKWFSILDVLKLLKRRNGEYNFSEKDIFQEAAQHILDNRLPIVFDFAIDNQRLSPDNISIYFYTDKIINAMVLDFDDGYKRCTSHIEITGYIPLMTKYIESLLENNKTLIKTFILPKQPDIRDKRILEIYEKDEYFIPGHTCQCEIDKEQWLQIDDININDLLIYRTDVAKLVKKYKKGPRIKSIDLPITTDVSVTDMAATGIRKRRKPEIDNYKCAAANCLAHIIWEKYPNILPSDLSKLWAFSIIRSYRYKDCQECDYFKNINQSTVKTSPDIDQPYKLVTSWIRKTKPKHLSLKGRPKKDINKLSIEEYKRMESTSSSLTSLITVLIRSLEYTDPQTEKKYNEFKERIDLDVIVDKIKSNDPELMDAQFWELFLRENKLSLKIWEASQSEAEITSG